MVIIRVENLVLNGLRWFSFMPRSLGQTFPNIMRLFGPFRRFSFVSSLCVKVVVAPEGHLHV